MQVKKQIFNVSIQIKFINFEKNLLITMIALIFVILKQSLQWRGEFYLYLDPVSEYLLFDPLLDDF